MYRFPSYFLSASLFVSYFVCLIFSLSIILNPYVHYFAPVDNLCLCEYLLLGEDGDLVCVRDGLLLGEDGDLVCVPDGLLVGEGGVLVCVPDGLLLGEGWDIV